MMLSEFLSRKNMIKMIHIRSSLYPLVHKKYYILDVKIYMKMNKKDI